MTIVAEAQGVVLFDIEKLIDTSAMAILIRFGESLPCEMGNIKLSSAIYRMVNVLRSMPDQIILNMQNNHEKMMTALINLYGSLSFSLYYYKPWLVGSVSLCMIELTMKTGLSSKSPVAFARFGSILVTLGYITDGCRLGEH